MRLALVPALAFGVFAVVGPASPQQGRQITADDVAAAQALLDQIKPACDAGSDNKACGILAYSPVDCSAKKTDAHMRQIYNTYEDRSVRFQSGGTQVVRRPPIALLAPIGIIGRDGATTQYAGPQFVSWNDYQAGKKSVTICGKSERVEAKHFTLDKVLQKFLKANP
jgi:hypothetical protein